MIAIVNVGPHDDPNPLGIRTYAHLLEWFQQTHALPFSGIVICWSNS